MNKRRYGLVLALWALYGPSAQAADVAIRVENDRGAALEGAVVYALPRSGAGASVTQAMVAIDQVDKEFVPFLTVVRPGTNISFPNSDNIRHHVYSFSEAKRFEIPLYGNTSAPSIEFDRAGVVALGCNVHDWMRAYVLVIDTPYYDVTGAGGSVTLSLDSGDYRLRVWHPEMRGSEAEYEQSLSVGTEAANARFSIEQKPQWRAWRGNDEFEEGY